MQNEGTDTKSRSREPLKIEEAIALGIMTEAAMALRHQVRSAVKGGGLADLRELTLRALEAGMVGKGGAIVRVEDTADTVETARRMLKELDAIEACAVALDVIAASCACGRCVAKRDAGGWVPPEDKPLVGVKSSKAAT
jgi:hypothetical protein